MTRAQTLSPLSDILAGTAPEASLAGVAGGEERREARVPGAMEFRTLVVALRERTGPPIREAGYPRLVTLDGILGDPAAATG